MNATVTRTLDHLNWQIDLAGKEVEDARIKYETMRSLLESMKDIIADQEKIDQQKGIITP